MNCLSRVILVVFALGATAADAELVDWGVVDGWTIMRETREPSCVLATTYEGEGRTILMITYTPGRDEARFSLSNSGWVSLVNEEKFKIDLDFGQQGKWTGVNVTAINESGIPTFFGNFDGLDFLTDIALAPWIRISRGDTVIDRLTLKNSNKAVLELVRCANSQNKGLLADPFAE